MSVIRKAAMAAVLCGSAQVSVAADESTPWLVRVHATHIAPDVETDPDIDADVDDKTIPELDISYFFTANIAAELVLTIPQRHDVTVGGDKIGSVKHLPPTLSLQYHLPLADWFHPYVGVGVNYTRFTDVDLAGGALDLEDDSVGISYQAGFDIPISDRMVINVDVKKIRISTDVKDRASGATVTDLDIDPLLVGVGVGWTF